MSIAVVIGAVEIAVAVTALLWLAKWAHRPWVTALCAYVFGVAAACSLGLAIHSILLQATGFADKLPHWLAVAWMIVGAAGFAIALALKPSPWVIAGPCGLIATASLAHSLCYREPLGSVLGVAMLVAASASIYGLAKRPRHDQLRNRTIAAAGLPEPGA